MRLGVFLRCLNDWHERPCVLTMSVAATASEIRLAGILRSYYSLASVHGWALVPPQQHGGFEVARLTPLNFQDATLREVVHDAVSLRLRFATGRNAFFELERDRDGLTAPPRATGTGRYLYVGGRRRPVPEDWMLD